MLSLPQIHSAQAKIHPESEYTMYFDGCSKGNLGQELAFFLREKKCGDHVSLSVKKKQIMLRNIVVLFWD